MLLFLVRVDGCAGRYRAREEGGKDGGRGEDMITSIIIDTIMKPNPLWSSVSGYVVECYLGV